jgi:hypothetical protein
MAKDCEDSPLDAGLNAPLKRKEWVKPRVLRTVAGGAENSIQNNVKDGQFTKS